MAFLCAHIADPRFADYGKVELVFSEGPEKIPGRLLTVLFWASFFLQTLLEGEGGGKADGVCFSIFPSCRSAPPPLPPGEEGCGMLQSGNVV